jgi:hypothetical protein
MAVIDPCRKCSKPVYHDGSSTDVLCDEHRAEAEKLEAQYLEKLHRMRKLLKHAQRTDCTDPDCEVHNPWVQEDDAERTFALCFYVAGAIGYAKHLDGFLEEWQQNIADEMRAPSHP